MKTKPKEKYNIHVRRLLESGEKFPIQECDALRFRGIGRKTLLMLRDAGIIENANDGLSLKAQHCLYSIRVRGKGEARAAIAEKILLPFKVTGYGIKLHREVCKWAGLPDPVEEAKSVTVCPSCGHSSHNPTKCNP